MARRSPQRCGHLSPVQLNPLLDVAVARRKGDANCVLGFLSARNGELHLAIETKRQTNARASRRCQGQSEAVWACGLID